MEIKKSHKADIDRRRPLILVASFCCVTLLFVAVLFIPFRSISSLIEDTFDDFTMDLDLKANEQDDMIAAEQPKQETVQEESTKLNKVDETTELPPENLDAAKEEEDNDSLQKKDEQPPINPNEDNPELIAIAEQLPQYPGGMSQFVKWLTETLVYPESAMKRKIQGKVVLSFIVEKDGTLSNLKVAKGAHRLLDAEAMRVAKLMPKWEAGKNNGKPCKTLVNLPIVFQL